MTLRYGILALLFSTAPSQASAVPGAEVLLSPSHSSVGRASDSRYPAPGYTKSPGTRRFGARLEPPLTWGGLWPGQLPHSVEVSEQDGPRSAMRATGHVKLSLLNSADYPEYPDRKVAARACVTSSASCGLCPRQSLHSNGSDYFFLILGPFGPRS